MDYLIKCYEDRNGDCYYQTGITLDTLDFHKRLEKAYKQAITLGTWKGRYAETNEKEYWAEGVRMWYYDIGPGGEFETHADFAARDPLLAEILDEWFFKDLFGEGNTKTITKQDILEAIR